MRAFNHEVGIYQVVTSYNNYSGGEGNYSHEIDIVARTFGCVKWQNIKIPCSHAIRFFSSICELIRDNALKCILVIYLCGRYLLITMLNLYN